ncbi:hypothetical protein QN224_13200 [Sinorhizobium sp. 8-89]|uniref:hypothetical protein n=1 Tax=Sinorhizobium sp. 7-81 TaxID=3049087 RepID=UPI0024C3B6D1|nr:hypothetical protein [Sinorhizobium sp. 7-81]MDK1386366.1 hypothetical protein [Sinorhizobium sp. 7-81]
MAHKLADLRAKHKAFKDEADAIFATAESNTGGELTDFQDQRLTAIKGEIAKLDGEIDAEIAALSPSDSPPAAAAATAAEAEAAERKRTTDIIGACKVAGKIDRAAAFIAEGKSLSQVVDVLQNERATESDKNGTSASNPARHGGQNASAGWDKAVAKHNQRNGFK